MLPLRQVPAQQPLNRLRAILCGSTVSNLPCNSSIFAHRSADAEIERVDHLSILLDLLALKPNVRNPRLPARVRASRHMQSDLLIELRNPLLELAHQPLVELLRLRNRQLAELRARARNRSAEEHRRLNLQPKVAELPDQLLHLRVRHIDDEDVLP